MTATEKPKASFTGKARMTDGNVIPYEIFNNGENKNRRVVLVHSLNMNRSFWYPVVESLSDSAEVLVYDCRGHGQATKPKGPYTVELFASDLNTLLNAVAWDSAVIGGASMGGCVSIAFAALHTDRCRALCLIDTTAWYGENAPIEWEERAQRALNDGFDAMIDFQKIRWFSDSFRRDHPEIVEEALSMFRSNEPVAYAEACRMLGAADLRPLLSRLSMPIRILVGEQDYATPLSTSEAMNAAIPGSSMRVITGARHLTPLEVPDEIASELKTLLKMVSTLH